MIIFDFCLDIADYITQYFVNEIKSNFETEHRKHWHYLMQG